jgi:hypothetical protein
MKYFFLLFLLSCSYHILAQPVGYSYGRTITIQDSQVPGTTNLTDFPVLISITADANLESVANGGHVESGAGNDIVFYTEDCLTKLDHQLELYAANTGRLVVWVRVPTLNAQANTVIHMYYGNASATNTSTNAVWDSNYEGVWHFTGNVSDATANVNDLNNNGTSNFGNSKIAQGRNLMENQSDYLDLPNNFFSGITNFTFEGWVLLDEYDTNWERIFDFGQNTTINFFFSPSTGTGTPAETRARITTSGAGNEQGPIVANSGTITGSWVHWAVVLNDAANTMSI